VTSVLSVRPIIEGLAFEGAAAPVRVVPAPDGAADPCAIWSARQWGDWSRLLDRVARRADIAGLTLARGVAFGDLEVFERVVSNRLALTELAGAVALFPDHQLAHIDELIADTIAGSFDVFFRKETTLSSDGLPLSVYSAGAGEAVVLVPACGMPAALAESWLRFLARDHRVVTWESRGLFGAAGCPGDYAVDTAVQAADLFAVMNYYSLPSAHLVGLCGGAVIALAAAAAEPARVSSLSLWHGAYELASGSPRTTFQNNLIELMAIAAHSSAAARSVQATFCQVAQASTPTEVAHLVLYPYTSAELFYRYCRLNGTLARTDVEPYLPKVKQPALVVTSQDDQTAHPQGSRQVADGLRNARLRVEPHGDHSSLFHADSTLMQVAVDFIAHARAAG
jgi:3-oxoadipate enol-lactonase